MLIFETTIPEKFTAYDYRLLIRLMFRLNHK